MTNLRALKMGLVFFILFVFASDAAAAACGPNSSIGEYVIGPDGRRVWCALQGNRGVLQTIVAFVAALFDLAGQVGGGKTAIAGLALTVFGVFVTGSERVRVRTYRNHLLIRDEIQGGVEALTDNGFLRLIGRLMKFLGIVVFFIGTFAFAARL